MMWFLIGAVLVVAVLLFAGMVWAVLSDPEPADDDWMRP